FRYICDNGTYKAFYDDLADGKDNKIDVSKVDVSMDGIELEDREFIAAIKEKREPNASLKQLLPCMHVLGKLEKIIDPQRKAHAWCQARRRSRGGWGPRSFVWPAGLAGVPACAGTNGDGPSPIPRRRRSIMLSPRRVPRYRATG